MHDIRIEVPTTRSLRARDMTYSLLLDGHHIGMIECECLSPRLEAIIEQDFARGLGHKVWSGINLVPYCVPQLYEPDPRGFSGCSLTGD